MEKKIMIADTNYPSTKLKKRKGYKFSDASFPVGN